MTRGATHANGAMIIDRPRNRRLVQTTIVPLMRAIASWMAIGAARMQNDLCGLFEERNGSRFLVIYVREVLGILQRLVSQSRVGDYGREKRSATGHRNREPKNPMHRHGLLRMSRARLCRRKIEIPARPHDTISSDRFTNPSPHPSMRKRKKMRRATMHLKPAVIEMDLGPTRQNVRFGSLSTAGASAG